MDICTFCGHFPAQQLVSHEGSRAAPVCEYCFTATGLKLDALKADINQMAYFRHCVKVAFYNSVYGVFLNKTRNRFNYDHPTFKEAACRCKLRAKFCCQRCGQKAGGVQAHHWAKNYKPARETTVDDLTALCHKCHAEITWIRRGLMSDQLAYPVYLDKLENAIEFYRQK